MDDEFDEEEVWEMGPDEILATAANVINGERQEEYGDAVEFFHLVASLWSAFTGFPISAHDACEMMSLFKKARAKKNPEHVDSYVDDAGYTALSIRMPAFSADFFVYESEDDADL